MLKQSRCLCLESRLCLHVITRQFTTNWEEVKRGRIKLHFQCWCCQVLLLEGRSAQFTWFINAKIPSVPGGLSRGHSGKPNSILKAGVSNFAVNPRFTWVPNTTSRYTTSRSWRPFLTLYYLSASSPLLGLGALLRGKEGFMRRWKQAKWLPVAAGELSRRGSLFTIYRAQGWMVLIHLPHTI